MSTVSSQAPQRLTGTVTTTGGGTLTSTAGAGGRFQSSLLATRREEAPVGGGRGFSSSSKWSARRRSSPSPPQKGSRTGLDTLASSANSPQFVSGMSSWRMPVTVLLQTLGLLSYKELSELRRVHPHWDELCGQLLNQGYYQLIGRAQWLLTESQRKLNREPRLAQPIQLLTRLHVHVLNPVDAMRSFLDEGVLCFPYGALLDRSFGILGRIEEIVAASREQISYDEASDQLDQLQELARRANVHYRQIVEPDAEKRMSEMYRLSAQQRLQRLDSFLVESSMSRVERESEKARSDMRWELEQLKEQNTQLKKENRDLKTLCVRLDGRVDVLERKFKTMARLLQ
uniref:F-box domain-containing protein n=1 Tax=Globodera pallida TaxID=36090 RepID=A0A183BNU6_GLOPA